MNHHHPHIYFLFGAWLSFIGVVIAGSTIVPFPSTVRALSPAAIYRSAVHEELREATTLPLSGEVIAIDEATKRLTLYEDGSSLRTYPIERLALPGSLSDVPSGSFSVSGKEPQHRSPSFAIWMPWAVVFGSNYSIHGKTKDESGQSAPIDTVSVELSDQDAKEVYEFAELGGKIVATGGAPRSSLEGPGYALSGGGQLPRISSTHFIVADIETGDTLWGRRADEEVPVGGLDAIGLALLSTETLDQYETVRLGDLLLPRGKRKAPPGNVDEVPIGSLLYPLLFNANETAGMSIKEKLSREREPLLASTTAEGSDSMRGLLSLFREVYQNERYILDASLRKSHELYDERGDVRYRWENKNPWVADGDVEYRGGLGEFSPGGGGSGMFLFSLPLSEFEHRPIAIVLVDSENVVADVEAIRSFLAQHYRYGSRREALENEEPVKPIERLRRFFRDELDYDRSL
jgi:hypothetical protein